MYRLGQTGCCIHRRVANTFMDLGEPPVFFDETVLEADIDRLRAFYEQEGYRSASVSARVRYTDRGSQVRITLYVRPGDPTFVRNVRFDGLGPLSTEHRRELLEESLLDPTDVHAADSVYFRARDQRYSEQELLEERSRMVTTLRNTGYARVSRDSVRVFVSQATADSLDLTFRIRPGRRYRFGDVHFSVTGPEETPSTRTDTLLTPDAIRLRGPDPNGTSATPSGWVTVQLDRESRLKPSVLTTALRFMPGEWYDQSRVLTTRRRLGQTGIFAFSEAQPLWGQVNTDPTPGSGPAGEPGTTAPDEVDSTASTPVLASSEERITAAGEGNARADTVRRLPHRIDLRTRPRHRIRLETFMLQREAILGPETRNELGTGLGTTYTNANLFGQAEILELGLSGSVSANLGRSAILPTAQAEFTSSITYPYLLGPLQRLDRALNLREARSRLSLSFLTARRQEFTIRGRGSAQLRLELRHRPDLASFVDVVDFNLSDPRLDPALLDSLRARIDDPFILNRLLDDFNTPQINNALRYTLRSMTVNPLRRTQGHSYEGILEFGGNLPYLLDRWAFTPGTLEGTLPGLPFFRGSGTDDRLVYHRYARALADVRRYEQIGRNTTLAWRVMGGIAHPIGRSEVVPFDRRFYAGGATSVRGWGLRELGPGVVRPEDVASSGFLSSGDVKLEASLESRTRFLDDVLAADWQVATFADLGNVWLGPKNPGPDAGRFRLDRFYRQAAVGSGIGLRAIWDYLVVRFDLGWKIHSPVPGERFFPHGLRAPRRHFGIGHVF